MSILAKSLWLLELFAFTDYLAAHFLRLALFLSRLLEVSLTFLKGEQRVALFLADGMRSVCIDIRVCVA